VKAKFALLNAAIAPSEIWAMVVADRNRLQHTVYIFALYVGWIFLATLFCHHHHYHQ